MLFMPKPQNVEHTNTKPSTTPINTLDHLANFMNIQIAHNKSHINVTKQFQFEQTHDKKEQLNSFSSGIYLHGIFSNFWSFNLDECTIQSVCLLQ